MLDYCIRKNLTSALKRQFAARERLNVRLIFVSHFSRSARQVFSLEVPVIASRGPDNARKMYVTHN